MQTQISPSEVKADKFKCCVHQLNNSALCAGTGFEQRVLGLVKVPVIHKPLDRQNGAVTISIGTPQGCDLCPLLFSP